MQPRVAQEWDELVSIHPEAKLADNPERVQFAVGLDEGTYSQDSTPAIVLIPVGYPTTPLDGFLVPAGLAFADGTALPLTGEGSAVGMPGWQIVSFHLTDDQGRSTWHPTADPSRGDNLIGYIASIESFIARRCS